jgi:hypothetical protein
LQTALADGSDPSGAASTGTRYAAVRHGFGNGGTPPGNGYGQGNGNGNGNGNTNGGAPVPEPAVLILMLLGALPSWPHSRRRSMYRPV